MTVHFKFWHWNEVDNTYNMVRVGEFLSPSRSAIHTLKSEYPVPWLVRLRPFDHKAPKTCRSSYPDII